MNAGEGGEGHERGNVHVSKMGSDRPIRYGDAGGGPFVRSFVRSFIQQACGSHGDKPLSIVHGFGADHVWWVVPTKRVRCGGHEEWARFPSPVCAWRKEARHGGVQDARVL